MMNDTDWIHPNDNAVRIVGFLQCAGYSGDGATSACTGNESIDLHGRWSGWSGWSGNDCIDDLWPSGVFMGERVVWLCNVRTRSNLMSCDTYVAILIQNDCMRNFTLQSLRHSCDRRGIQPREVRKVR